MRITSITDLHADGGWRPFSFVKITTDEGLVGWSEYSESGWAPGLTWVIRKLGESLIGQDPRQFAKIGAGLRATVRMTPGGLNDQALAALENACIDIAAKAAGVSAAALFGGPVRDRLPMYWSHCGSFRASQAQFFEETLGTAPLRKLDDLKALGAEIAARGYSHAKTNPIGFDGPNPRMLNPGFRPQGLDLGRNASPKMIHGIVDQMAAMRDGAGPDVGLMLDVNFGFSGEALRRLAHAIEPLDLTWLEVDVHDPAVLADVRRRTRTPIASLEAQYRVRGYLPYLQAGACDVAVVDVLWNGMVESLHIAAAAEALEVNVAPHNFYGHLASYISAQFCAAVPNFRIMEYETDDVPWKDEFFTHPPVIENGAFIVPTRPGWGTDINEDAVRTRPAKLMPGVA